MVQLYKDFDGISNSLLVATIDLRLDQISMLEQTQKPILWRFEL